MGHDFFDIVVVGSGPAGSSAAIRLAASGRRVLLIDRAAFPRPKLCGEFVSPECIDHLRELGVSHHVDQVLPPCIDETVFYSSKGRSFAVPSKWLGRNGGDAIGISRSALDQALAERSAAVGAVFEPETSLIDLSAENESRVVLSLRSGDGSMQNVTASTVIDATGRGRYLARKFDSSGRNVKPGQVAFKAHFRGAGIAAGACEIFSYPGGYGGCSRIEDGLYNLCFIVDAALVRQIGNSPSSILNKTVFKNSRAKQVLRNASIESDWLSVPLARYGSQDPAPAPRIIAVGDAAAFIDPFTGSGIAMSFESSGLACRAICDHSEPEEVANAYRRSHHAAFGRRLKACRALRVLSASPRFADAMIAALGASRPLRRFLARTTRSTRTSEI